MTKAEKRAGEIVADALLNAPAPDRVDFLRSVAAHALAGLVCLLDVAEASEIAFRLADALVARGAPDRVPA